ncbi:hypothetical protein Hypma_002040 [Hypsizygus marmoreus]|uniref:Uncharacterized protein n=1 Tax=Hypsizygus marmoreus TaxID=39966 RepID=A0A369JC86_HYPMA|nr:hypothetical protein Hypma_002040 [Hypsizygus marmoreus]
MSQPAPAPADPFSIPPNNIPPPMSADNLILGLSEAQIHAQLNNLAFLWDGWMLGAEHLYLIILTSLFCMCLDPRLVNSHRIENVAMFDASMAFVHQYLNLMFLSSIKPCLILQVDMGLYYLFVLSPIPTMPDEVALVISLMPSECPDMQLPVPSILDAVHAQWGALALPMDIKVIGEMTNVLAELTSVSRVISRKETWGEGTSPMEDAKEDFASENQDTSSHVQTNTGLRLGMSSPQNDRVISTEHPLVAESPSVSRNEVEISESMSPSLIDSGVGEHVESIVPIEGTLFIPASWSSSANQLRSSSFEDTTMDFLFENHVNNLRPPSGVRRRSDESSRVIDTVILTNESFPSSTSGPDQNQVGFKYQPINIDAVSASNITTLFIATPNQ